MLLRDPDDFLSRLIEELKRDVENGLIFPERGVLLDQMLGVINEASDAHSK